MEALYVILPILRIQDWAVLLDLKDAYLHVPGAPSVQETVWVSSTKTKLTCTRSWSFGLKDSPWVFLRIVATVIAHLRLQGIRDILLSDRLTASRRVPVAPPVPPSSHSSVGPGFGVHRHSAEAAVLTLQRMPVFLGASLDIPRFDRMSGGSAEWWLIQEHTASPTVPALLWQRVLGHLASFVDLVPNCRLLMRPLQLHFLRFVSPLSGSQSKLIPLVLRNQGSVGSLGVSGSASRREAFPPHSLVLTSDASQFGWGA